MITMPDCEVITLIFTFFGHLFSLDQIKVINKGIHLTDGH